MRSVDVAIIGAGSAGLAARREVVKKTDNYVVIDNGILGTTCARVGCMPSKVLIQVAYDFDRRKKLAQEGIYGAEKLTINYEETMQHVRNLRDRFVRSVDSGMATWVTEKSLLREKATFIDNHILQVGSNKIRAEKIIIAAGSSPTIPKIFEPFKDFLIDTNEFFELPTLPKRMAVIGLGVIGLELGQALHRLEIEVTLIGRRRVFAGLTDPELNEYVAKKFSEEMKISLDGIDKVEKVKDGIQITSGDKKIIVDKVLVTTGRHTNLKGVGIENTSATFNESGGIVFDPHTFLVKGTQNIFVGGDATGLKNILHEASDEGRIVGHNAVNPIKPFQTRTPLMIVFTDPNIAQVGKTYSELINEKVEFGIGKVSFEGQGRSIIKLKEIGLLHIYGEILSGKILGAEIFAPNGEHLAHLLSWVISMNMTVNQVLALPFYHPVVEEGLRTALRDLRDKVNEKAPELEIFPL